MERRIELVDTRDKLAPRRDPYWRRISKGCYLGFRKMTPGSDGTWIARFRDDVSNRQTFHALGDFSAVPAGERYDLAAAAAEEWFKHRRSGGSHEKSTVRDACERYIHRLEDDGRTEAAIDAKGRFRRWVYPSKVADKDLMKLRAAHFVGLVRDLRKMPVAVGEGAPDRERSESAVNRDMSALRAALNLALEDGLVTSPFAWAKALKPTKNADKRRQDKLDRVQRTSLISSASGALAAFLKGLSLLPVRPGALASLKVKDFDSRRSVLLVGKDKAGMDREIALPEGTAAFFREHSRGKLPEAPLIANDTGGFWNKDQWKGPIKAAVKAAGLPESTTAYAMRHGVITDLVANGLDPLTVAKLSGTSVLMIERHYYHLTEDRSRMALAALG